MPFCVDSNKAWLEFVVRKAEAKLTRACKYSLAMGWVAVQWLL